MAYILNNVFRFGLLLADAKYSELPYAECLLSPEDAASHTLYNSKSEAGFF